MNAAGWLSAASGLALIGACAILLWLEGRHGDQFRGRFPALHGRVHPWLYRLLTFGMFIGACAVALTSLGSWVISGELHAVTFIAGLFHAGAGAVYVTCLIAGMLALGVVLLGAWLEPGRGIACWALALPFICALSGGHLHGVLTVFPVTEWASQVAAWFGGRPGAHG